MANQVISLHLLVQKTDPGAKGAWRALPCRCQKEEPVTCPFHAGRKLVELQLSRLRVSTQLEVQGKGFPLIGQLGDPRRVVEKEDMISHAQKLATLMKAEVNDASDLAVERVTGHFARRSGVKFLARSGVPVASIQWLSRHSSNVVWQYIEDSWAECPRADMQMSDVLTTCDLVTAALNRVDPVEEHLRRAEEMLEEQVEKAVPPEWIVQNKEELRNEIRKAMRPVAIISGRSDRMRAVNMASCVNPNPKMWQTSCGWPWIDAACQCKLIFEEDEVGEGQERCVKCYPRAM